MRPETSQYRRDLRDLTASLTVAWKRVWSILDMRALDATFPPWLVAVAPIVGAGRTLASRLAASYLAKLTDYPSADPELLDIARFAVSMRVTSIVEAKVAMRNGATLTEASQLGFSSSVGSASRFVLDAGRETITATAIVDPNTMGWRRVGAGECEFCRRLIREGTVHTGPARFPSHDRCHCSAEPVFVGDAAASPIEAPPAAAPVPVPAAQRAVGDMSDDEIEEALATAWASGDQDAADRLMLAIDEREQARQPKVPKSQAHKYTTATVARWSDDDFDTELVRLMQPDENGWVDQEAVDQLAFLMDAREEHRKADEAIIRELKEEADARQAARRELDKKARRRPQTIDEQVRSDYETYLQVQWLQAEDECNGVLLNNEGRAAGIDPRTLWQGTTVRARKYASEELKTFWQRHGRINYQTFRADALGRRSDRAAREATTKEGWYDSAG